MTPSEAAEAAPALVTSPMTPPLPPPPRSAGSRSDSKLSIHSGSDEASTFTTKTQEYMDSLKPPSSDQFERIKHVQEEKEGELKRKARSQKRESMQLQRQRDEMSLEDHQARTAAARTIQKTFRGYRARREMEGHGLDATTRWISAIHEAQFRESNRPQARSTVGGGGGGASLTPDHARGSLDGARPSSAREHWKKASIIARRAGHDGGESESESESSSDEDATPQQKAEAKRQRDAAKAKRKSDARMMGLQYFLEMVDLKHRYGSNLRSYHEVWKSSDTNENFFYWLDHGEGKNFELATCPRERLDREQVRYLSREERQYYLVRVDSEGRLCWAKNGARIDTSEAYKDSIHGIVPQDDPTPAFNPSANQLPTPRDSGSDTSSLSSIESRREADRAAKYATPDFDDGKAMHKVTHLSASTIFNKLLRKSVRKGTWIFVADTSYRLFVGIKDSGAFQHSSFLQGSRISAAGLIKIKNGRLSSLSPLSGHYRPPASNFRAFVKNLNAAGVDMSHVSISRAYTVLVGLEAYVKTRRKGKDLVHKMMHRRDKMLAPEAVKRREEEQKDKSESAARERQVIAEEQEEEDKEREENRLGVKVLQKLKISPAVPRGQHGGKDTGSEEASTS